MKYIPASFISPVLVQPCLLAKFTHPSSLTATSIEHGLIFVWYLYHQEMSEFKHFLSVVVSSQEVPSYLEILILMVCDVRRAFWRWRRKQYRDVHRREHAGDNGQWCKMYKIPMYWFDMTCKAYCVAMIWKFKQLIKLTFGFWVSVEMDLQPFVYMGS